jgi:hypothetical protein
MVGVSTVIACGVLAAGQLLPAAVPAPVALPASPLEASDLCLDAPLFSSASLSGSATLCKDGRTLRAALLVHGLEPGEEYTVWLSYVSPNLCRDTPCGPADLPGDDPAGQMVRIDGGIAPSTGTMKLGGEHGNVRVLRGGQVVLTLLQPGGRAGPHAQVVFMIP